MHMGICASLYHAYGDLSVTPRMHNEVVHIQEIKSCIPICVISHTEIAVRIRGSPYDPHTHNEIVRIWGLTYTRWSSGYNVRSTHALSKWQGGISLFWRTSGTYEIEEVEIRGPNVLGAARWYIIGCYIPPNDLTTLTHVNEVWRACPKGCLPILLGDLNVNLAAPRNKRNDTIADQVYAMALIDMSTHFRQRRGRRSRGRWTWRMRRRRRWVSSQCDYILGRATDLGRWIRRVSVRMPFCHDSNHRAIVAKIRAGGGREMKRYRKKY
jgi:hypothetical protein